MQRRKFLAGLGAMAAGGAAVMGTGAFTSVSADRSVTVETNGDQSALLEITKATEGGSTTPNAEEYVSYDSDGKVQIDVPNANKEAWTKIRKLLDLRNAGTQSVVITHEQDFSVNKVSFSHSHRPPWRNSQVDKAGEQVSGWDPLSGTEPQVTNQYFNAWGVYPILGPGETLKFFGMSIGGDSEDAEIGDETITINAKTPQEYRAEGVAPDQWP